MKHYLMKCGHIANAKVADTGEPVCVICDCFEIEKEIDEIENREAKCTECGCKTKSKVTLPFFKYRPDKEYDEYYCGCYRVGLELLEEWEGRKEKFGSAIIVSIGMLLGELICGFLSFAQGNIPLFKLSIRNDYSNSFDFVGRD